MRVSSQSGFTLLELIVVMAIIGLLIAATASTFRTSLIKGHDSRRKSDLKQIQSALEAYLNDHALYPTASGGKIVACGAGPSACDWGDELKDGNGTTYMAKIPIDEKSPTYEYLYVVSSDQKSFQLFAHLENDQDRDYATYTGKDCGTLECNFGISSTNTTPASTLP
jgi:type II secretion system protein G